MRTKTNPVFYADELRLELAGQPERLARIFEDPDSVDLLTWNVFTSLDRHTDRDYLAYRLRAVGGDELRAPVRLSLWTGRDHEPLLHPGAAYVAMIRQRARAAGGDQTSTAELEAPIEVPVRIESPYVVVLVDTLGETPRTGAGGRSRIIELVDAGLYQARRLSKQLAVAFVYRDGTAVGADVASRLQRLREPAALAAALPHREQLPPVALLDVSWQQLLRIWEQELPYLGVPGRAARAFAEHVRARGLL
jgi:hypothetical protein